MPYAKRRGARIHYTLVGSGPVVVFLHGLLMAGSWSAGGIATELSRDFTVVCVDSLGDGASDKPSDPERYTQAERAEDVAAVLDEIGCDRAHVVGYSMGGWLAVGLARHHPARLVSLAIGGWDIEAGLAPGPAGPLTFDQFLAFAQRAAPALTASITQESRPGLRACFEAMGELKGAAEAVEGCERPVLLWSGEHDPYRRSMEAFAHSRGFPFIAVEGDHLTAVYKPAPSAVEGLREFLASAVQPIARARSNGGRRRLPSA